MTSPRLVAIGVGLAIAYLAATRLLVGGTGVTELAVELNETDPTRSRLAASDPSRVSFEVDGVVASPEAPLADGLRYLSWTERYRGGFHRQVGAAVRVGPRQDAASPPCSVRVRVGQMLLDRGVAQLARSLLSRELRGFRVFPLGDFKEVSDVHLRWAEGGALPALPAEILGAKIDPPPAGFLALRTEIVFERASLPIFVALAPELSDGVLTLRALADVKVIGTNRVYRAIIGAFDGDRRATGIAQSELGNALIEILAPPPPLVLAGGGTIEVEFCRGEPLRVREGAYLEVPLAVRLSSGQGRAQPLALTIPQVDPPTEIATAIQLELDANALSALLHQAWAGGALDSALASADLTGRFNRDPDVASLLTVRAHELRFAGPPAIGLTRDGFDLAADLNLTISDGKATREASLFARARLDLTTSSARDLTARLAAGGLTCRRGEVLYACYDVLVAELIERAPQASSVLGRELGGLFEAILADREIRIEGLPAALELGEAALTARQSRLIIDFDAALE